MSAGSPALTRFALAAFHSHGCPSLTLRPYGLSCSTLLTSIRTHPLPRRGRLLPRLCRLLYDYSRLRSLIHQKRHVHKAARRRELLPHYAYALKKTCINDLGARCA